MVPLYLLIAYVAVGIAVALAFVTIGIAQVQAMPVTVGARILLRPGAFVLWPLVASRSRCPCRAHKNKRGAYDFPRAILSFSERHTARSPGFLLSGGDSSANRADAPQ
jgi:hypothetical protein